MTLPQPGIPRDAAPVVTSIDARSVGVSPKAVAATAVSAVIGVILAFLTLLPNQPGLLAGLPPIVQALILLAVPPLVTLFATYRAAVGAVALPPVDQGR
jgi:membrane glycosyltransferase